MVVGSAPAGKPGVLFERQRHVPRLNTHVSLHALQKDGVLHLRAPMLLQSPQQNALIVFVFRQRAGNTGDGHSVNGAPWGYSNGAWLSMELSEFLRVEPVVREIMGECAEQIARLGNIFLT